MRSLSPLPAGRETSDAGGRICRPALSAEPRVPTFGPGEDISAYARNIGDRLSPPCIDGHRRRVDQRWAIRAMPNPVAHFPLLGWQGFGAPQVVRRTGVIISAVGIPPRPS